MSRPHPRCTLCGSVNGTFPYNTLTSGLHLISRCGGGHATVSGLGVWGPWITPAGVSGPTTALARILYPMVFLLVLLRLGLPRVAPPFLALGLA